MATSPSRFTEEGDSYLAVDRRYMPPRVLFGPDAETIKMRVSGVPVSGLPEFQTDKLEAELQKLSERGFKLRRVPG